MTSPRTGATVTSKDEADLCRGSARRVSVGYISLQMMIRHDGLLMQKAIDEFVVVF